MKGAYPAAIAALCCVMASPAAAQSPPVRPDLYFSAAWVSVNKDELGTGNNWFNRGFDAGATFGWYWTPHLKTEIEASAGPRATFDSAGEIRIDGRPVYASTESAFSRRRVSVGQRYQFGENAWFHPHVGAGIDFNWETIDRYDREVYSFTLSAPQKVRDPVRHPQRTELHVRPFVDWGFKAYMTERAFFRSDLRFVAAKRLEDVSLRFGFGMDL